MEVETHMKNKYPNRYYFTLAPESTRALTAYAAKIGMSESDAAAYAILSGARQTVHEGSRVVVDVLYRASGELWGAAVDVNGAAAAILTDGMSKTDIPADLAAGYFEGVVEAATANAKDKAA